MKFKLAIGVAAALLAPAALAVTWTCMGICGAVIGGTARMTTGQANNSGSFSTASGGGTEASDAYTAALAACSTLTSGKATALGKATDSGNVVLAMPAEICVKN